MTYTSIYLITVGKIVRSAYTDIMKSAVTVICIAERVGITALQKTQIADVTIITNSVRENVSIYNIMYHRFYIALYIIMQYEILHDHIHC